MNRIILAVSAVAIGLVLASGKADAGAGLYDVDPALRAPHPFAAPGKRFTLPAEALSYPNAPGPLYASPAPAPAPVLPSDALSYPNDPGLEIRREPAPFPHRVFLRHPVKYTLTPCPFFRDHLTRRLCADHRSRPIRRRLVSRPLRLCRQRLWSGRPPRPDRPTSETGKEAALAHRSADCRRTRGRLGRRSGRQRMSPPHRRDGASRRLRSEARIRQFGLPDLSRAPPAGAGGIRGLGVHRFVRLLGARPGYSGLEGLALSFSARRSRAFSAKWPSG